MPIVHRPDDPASQRALEERREARLARFADGLPKVSGLKRSIKRVDEEIEVDAFIEREKARMTQSANAGLDRALAAAADADARARWNRARAQDDEE